MKKITLLFLLISNALFSYGQELKTIKKKVEEQYGKAVFYVLADNDTVKHGLYLMKAYTGTRLLYKGNYDHNKKVGFWEEKYYFTNNKGPKAQGYYENDQKIGKWVYFSFSGDTVQIYNWTDRKMVFLKSCGTDTTEYTIIENGLEKKSRLDCPPTCISGLDYFLYEFERDVDETKFKEVGNKLYELKTKISILIDENNSVMNVSLSTNESAELKDFIEQYIRSFEWIAGKKDGQNIASTVTISINTSSQF
jgi:hypothetical protein